jgi:hypothetical protein
MPPSTAANWGLSPRWPAVTRIDSGRWPPSTARCSLLVSPPRSVPGRGRAARCRVRLVLRAGAPPIAGARGVLMGPDHRGIDADLPDDQPLGVGLGLQVGEDLLPGAVALPAAKQPIHRLPRPVAGGGVPPRLPGPGPPADPIDQLALAPGGWPAGLLTPRQQRLQPGPLLVGQVPSSHPRSMAPDPPTSESGPSGPGDGPQPAPGAPRADRRRPGRVHASGVASPARSRPCASRTRSGSLSLSGVLP